MLGSRLSQRSRRELILRECTSDEGLEAVRKGELDLCLLHPPRNVDPAEHDNGIAGLLH